MKKSILVLAFVTFSLCTYASKTVVPRSAKITESCTMTATQSNSATVDCPDGSTITITATSSSSASAESCETAYQLASILADLASNQTVMNNVKAKSYICPE